MQMSEQVLWDQMVRSHIGDGSIELRWLAHWLFADDNLVEARGQTTLKLSEYVKRGLVEVDYIDQVIYDDVIGELSPITDNRGRMCFERINERTESLPRYRFTEAGLEWSGENAMDRFGSFEMDRPQSWYEDSEGPVIWGKDNWRLLFNAYEATAYHYGVPSKPLPFEDHFAEFPANLTHIRSIGFLSEEAIAEKAVKYGGLFAVEDFEFEFLAIETTPDCTSFDCSYEGREVGVHFYFTNNIREAMDFGFSQEIRERI